MTYQLLTTFHNDEFLLGGGPSEDHLGVQLKSVNQLLARHVLQLAAIDDTGPSVTAETTTRLILFIFY